MAVIELSNAFNSKFEIQKYLFILDIYRGVNKMKMLQLILIRNDLRITIILPVMQELTIASAAFTLLADWMRWADRIHKDEMN